MSLPRQINSHSSSPSKSSLRRPSNPVNPSSRNPSLLPSPHFHEPLVTSEHTSPEPEDHDVEEDAQEDHHPSHFTSSLHQPPTIPNNFVPFFTLIEDPVTREHHHPTVHYIFADDDGDIITEAACRSLESSDPSDSDNGISSQAIASDSTRAATSHYLPLTVPGVKEHYLIVDIHANPTATTPAREPNAQSQTQGQPPPHSWPETPLPLPTYSVGGAKSLSASWQVLHASISAAPTIGDNNPSDEGEGLMLRIEGRGNTPPDMAAREKEKESLEAMIERFQRRLEDVRLVMEGGSGGGS